MMPFEILIKEFGKPSDIVHSDRLLPYQAIWKDITTQKAINQLKKKGYDVVNLGSGVYAIGINGKRIGDIINGRGIILTTGITEKEMIMK